jgi:hypothetical protein
MEEIEQLKINNNINNNDDAFNRLQKLQILLKKESAMKELCKIYLFIEIII